MHMARKNSINPMDESQQTLRTGSWRFGPNWAGQRCGAKTRAGTPCQKPALTGKTRCQLHGGRGGAPSGKRNGNYRTGKFTKEALRERSEAVARVRGLAFLGRKHGML